MIEKICRLKIIESIDHDQTARKRDLFKKIFFFNKFLPFGNSNRVFFIETNEPRHEKTSILHMRKQRRRSASR